jgi:hypothetical protein
MKELTMNTRICSVVTVITLLTLATGCSGTRSCLFGRGARCGACSSLSQPQAPNYNATPQTPCGTSYTPDSTCNQNLATAPYNGGGCNSGCNTYGGSHAVGCGGNCGVVDQYVDPYLSGGVVTGDGQIIPGTVGNGIDDGFQARRYDEHGDRIVSEGPYVPTPTPQQ